MTDEEILEFVTNIDIFLTEQANAFQITPLDMSAIIHSRLRMMNDEVGSGDDYDAFLDHLIGNSTIVNTTVH
jgi:hypothetical protein